MNRGGGPNVETTKVFVYGTLKRGQVNYAVACRAGAHSVTPAKLTGFQLFDLGPYPALLAGEGNVYGQVLDYGPGINGALVALDRLENFCGTGNPDNYYNRVLTTALVLDPRADAEHLVSYWVSCWLYVYNRPLEADRLLPEGVWPARSPSA